MRLRIWAAFAALYLIWGSTFLAIRFVLDTVAPFVGAGIRFLLAGGLVYVWLRWRGAERPTSEHWRKASVAGASMILVGYGAVFWAQQTVPSGATSLFVATGPLWIAVLSAAWDRQRLTLGTVIGLVLGFLGVAVLIEPGEVVGQRIDTMGAGGLVLAAISWAWGSLYFRREFRGFSTLMGTAMAMLTGGALLMAVAGINGELALSDLGSVSPLSVLSLVYLVVFGSVIAFSAYLWLLKVTDPVKVSTYGFVNPVIAVLLGWRFAGETIDVRIALGTGMIVAAVALMISTPSRASRVAPMSALKQE
jgi:drug/metabolite transporter (DMT)-like permease